MSAWLAQVLLYFNGMNSQLKKKKFKTTPRELFFFGLNLQKGGLRGEHDTAPALTGRTGLAFPQSWINRPAWQRSRVTTHHGGLNLHCHTSEIWSHLTQGWICNSLHKGQDGNRPCLHSSRQCLWAEINTRLTSTDLSLLRLLSLAELTGWVKNRPHYQHQCHLADRHLKFWIWTTHGTVLLLAEF